MENDLPQSVIRICFVCSLLALVSGVAWLALSTEYLFGAVCTGMGLVGCIFSSAWLKMRPAQDQ